MIFRSIMFLLSTVLVLGLAGCDEDSCGAHQHEYFGRCVCDYNYMLVGDVCIPIPEQKGWCPGDLVCTQLANDYMACINSDGTLPGDPTVECPDYPEAEGNTSFVDLNGESVCILHCGECSSGECDYVGYGYKYTCVELRDGGRYVPADVNTCEDNSDCRANRSCLELGPGFIQKYCLEHCSISRIGNGDTDTGQY